MKTIIEGKTSPSEPPAWWVSTMIDCSKCGARITLEANDQVASDAEKHPGGRQWVTITCPNQGCGNELTADRPQSFGYRTVTEAVDAFYGERHC